MPAELGTFVKTRFAPQAVGCHRLESLIRYAMAGQARGGIALRFSRGLPTTNKVKANKTNLNAADVPPRTSTDPASRYRTYTSFTKNPSIPRSLLPLLKTDGLNSPMIPRSSLKLTRSDTLNQVENS